MTAKARSNALGAIDDAGSVISTNVPKIGRARRSSELLEHVGMGGEKAFDAIGDMTTGEGGAGYVFNVVV